MVLLNQNSKILNTLLIAAILALLSPYCSCDDLLDKKIEVFKELLEKIRSTIPPSKKSSELAHLLVYKASGNDHSEYIGDLEGLAKIGNKEVAKHYLKPETLLPSEPFVTFRPY